MRACEPSLMMGAEKKHSVFSVFFVHVARSHVHERTRSVAPSSGHLHTHHDHGPCARMYVCMRVCVHVGRCELVFRQINAERRVSRPVAVPSWKKGAGPPKDLAESEWQGTVTVLERRGNAGAWPWEDCHLPVDLFFFYSMATRRLV